MSFPYSKTAPIFFLLYFLLLLLVVVFQDRKKKKKSKQIIEASQNLLISLTYFAFSIPEVNKNTVMKKKKKRQSKS